MNATAILRRACSRAINTPWHGTNLSIARKFVLDVDLVVPRVAEIILVDACGSFARQDLIHSDLAVVDRSR